MSDPEISTAGDVIRFGTDIVIKSYKEENYIEIKRIGLVFLCEGEWSENKYIMYIIWDEGHDDVTILYKSYNIGT